MIGQTVAHYRVIEKIGEGGMGVVYRARDTKLNRDVALKILPQIFAQDSQRMARFEREAQVLASLNHSHIAQIHGLEEADGTKALVLELVEGETLAEQISRGPIPVDEALKIALQIAEGLEAAHEKGIIHRDLKPANIKITPEGEVKILDFGLAKAMEGPTSATNLSQSPTISMQATQAGVILGTAAYMSPEQASGKPLDKRTDIWAFGCVLYEMLSGKRSFEGETVTEIIASVLKSEPDWNALPRDVPPGIRWLLRRCLSKHMKRRLQAAGDAVLEIDDEIVGNVEPHNSGSGISPRAGRPWIAWFVAAVAVLSSLIIVTTQWPDITKQPFQLELELTDIDVLGLEFTVSLDGHQLVYVGKEPGGTSHLYHRDLQKNEIRQIPYTAGANFPFFSPDGRWVGFHTGGELRRIPLAGGPASTICKTSEAIGASWGSDGRIVFGSMAGGLSEVAAEGGEAFPITSLAVDEGEMAHRWPRHVGNTGLVAFTVVAQEDRFETSYCAVLSLKDRERKLLVPRGFNPVILPTGYVLFIRSNSLMAARFEVDSVAVLGEPVVLIDEVSVSVLLKGYYTASDNGILAYVAKEDDPAQEFLIYRVDRRGHRQDLNLDPGFRQPRYSPDGTQLAFSALSGVEGKIYVLGMDRETPSYLDVPGTAVWPTWSPNGQRIAFTSLESGQWNIWWVPVDGSAPPEQLTFSQDVRQIPNSFSPAGYLVFEEGPMGQRDIRILPLQGDREAYDFRTTDFNERGAQFSPDGKWIAFTSDLSGQDEIWVKSFSDEGGVYQISTEGGKEAVWSKNGTELFYRSGDKMMAVSVQTQPNFAAQGSELLFEGWYTYGYSDWSLNYDVSPDGESFIIPSEPGSAKLQVMTDLFEELRLSVPTE